MPQDIAFLHTAAVHEPTFSALLAELGPGLVASHHVHPDLLSAARTEGITPALESRIASAMRSASRGGAPVVVCTCSTLGGVAESMDGRERFRALRIDRAMADRAVAIGRRMLVVVALPSTREPTLALLRSSAERQRAGLDASVVVSERAWALFEEGDVDAYLDTVEASVREHLTDHGAVVLAQASMAPVTVRCDDLPVPVLCSPRPGVEAAVAIVRGLRLQGTGRP